MMKIKTLESVDAAIRTLSPDERQIVSTWFNNLKNWENDESTRKVSKPTADPEVRVLNTADDIRIFFTIDPEVKEITVLDIAKPSRLKTIEMKTIAE